MKNRKKRVKQIVFIGCVMVLPFFVFWMKKQEDDRFLGLKEITVQEKNEIMEKRRIERSGLLDILYFNQEEIIKDKDNIYYLPLSDKEEWEKGKLTGKKEGINICIVTEGKRKKKQEYQSEGEAFPDGFSSFNGISCGGNRFSGLSGGNNLKGRRGLFTGLFLCSKAGTEKEGSGHPFLRPGP